jgi:hypothetical protein
VALFVFTITAEYRVELFENRMLRTIFTLKSEAMGREYEQLQAEELNIL